jgi:hypothetical protein
VGFKGLCVRGQTINRASAARLPHSERITDLPQWKKASFMRTGNELHPPRPNPCLGGFRVLAVATMLAGVQAASLLTEKSNRIRKGAKGSTATAQASPRYPVLSSQLWRGPDHS